MDNIKTITGMEQEHIDGIMEIFIEENIKTIKDLGLDK